jgi:hypothetical protein
MEISNQMTKPDTLLINSLREQAQQLDRALDRAPEDIDLVNVAEIVHIINRLWREADYSELEDGL